ncbi:MAG: hypothetical protein MUF34_28665 [Polyangiaceae bacterium]|nr:hypothetical protein [Polyangiaceae bacterium]
MPDPSIAWRVASLAGSLLAALALGACSSEREQGRGAASNAPPSAAPASASAAPQPRPSAALLDEEGEALLALIRRWSAALDAHDDDALLALYGAAVRFYGRDSRREGIVASKRAAFAKGYRQSIGPIALDRADPRRPRATFAKRWVAAGVASEVTGQLAFEKEGGHWLIVEESDAKTEARRLANGDACRDAVFELVAATATAKAMLAGPTNPAAGHHSNGLHFGSIPPESATYQVGLHETHTTHVPTIAWFEVDPKSGAVRQTMPAERKIEASPQLQEKVRDACRTP